MGKIKIEKKDIWIDMTPMSDVMTLLLCFFMLTSTFLQPEPIKVNTPSSVSEAKIPENNVLNILIGADGKIFVGSANKNDMNAMLQTMAANFDIKLNGTQLKNFGELSMIGSSVGVLGEVLSMEPDKANEAIAQLGIPTDSIGEGKSEFQEWVAAARDANADMKLAIKCDATTPYKVVKVVMNQLQDMNENRYTLVTNLKQGED